MPHKENYVVLTYAVINDDSFTVPDFRIYSRKLHSTFRLVVDTRTSQVNVLRDFIYVLTVYLRYISHIDIKYVKDKTSLREQVNTYITTLINT